MTVNGSWRCRASPPVGSAFSPQPASGERDAATRGERPHARARRRPASRRGARAAANSAVERDGHRRTAGPWRRTRARSRAARWRSAARCPSPESEPAHSANTAPITATAAAIFAPVNAGGQRGGRLEEAQPLPARGVERAQQLARVGVDVAQPVVEVDRRPGRSRPARRAGPSARARSRARGPAAARSPGSARPASRSRAAAARGRPAGTGASRRPSAAPSDERRGEPERPPPRW